MKRKPLLFTAFAVAIVIAAVVIFNYFTANNSQNKVKNEKIKVTIAHAICDENGERYGGEAGDQTGDEVHRRSYYKSSWLAVVRAKNPEAAEIIASSAEAACDNENIGYDQYERTTLYECAKAANWDLSKIDKKCETDCSALVSVCVNAAGIKVSRDIYTGNLKEKLIDTGEFELLTEDKYTEKPNDLKRGDILIKKGHTVIVLSNSNTN